MSTERIIILPDLSDLLYRPSHAIERCTAVRDDLRARGYRAVTPMVASLVDEEGNYPTETAYLDAIFLARAQLSTSSLIHVLNPAHTQAYLALFAAQSIPTIENLDLLAELTHA